MTLGEILDQLEELHDDSTIYVVGAPEDASPHTPAIVVSIPEEGPDPPPPEGLTYLLEVDHAKSVVRTWREWSGEAEPSAAEKCRAVVHYSVNDAYLEPGHW